MKRVHNLELDICLLLFWVFPGMAYTFELICSYVHVGITVLFVYPTCSPSFLFVIGSPARCGVHAAEV